MSASIESFGVLQEAQVLTANVLNDLYVKWQSMYDITAEFKTKRENTFIKYLKVFYQEMVDCEEKKRLDMVSTIDRKMQEYYQLQKDLQLASCEELPWKDIREPYAVFIDDIENSMKQYEEMRNKRLSQLEILRSEEKELCDILEVPPLPEFPNPIPNDQQLDEVESHIFHLREKRINRVVFYNDAKGKIIGLMKQLEHEPVGDFEIEVLSSNEKSFIPSTSNITKLQNLMSSLEKECEEQIGYRQSLIDKLTKVWDRIKVEEPQRESFLSRHPSVTRSDIKALIDEIARCEEIKLANIEPIVEQIREQIREMWDLLTFTDEQRQEFKPFMTDNLSEDVLDLHELEIENLKQFYEKYRHLYDLIEKRSVLCDRMLHLDEIAQDKTRLFNNRGGQLLKEEKERKSLEINLPRVDNQLKRALSEFEEAEGRPFLWHGTNFLQRITSEWEERIAAKESKKLARKVENQKQIEVEAKLGSRAAVSKRKLGTPISNVSAAKTRRRDDLGNTVILQGSVRASGRLPNIRTPLNVSTASIASYSHFQSVLNDLNGINEADDTDLSENLSTSEGDNDPQDGLEMSERLEGRTPRSALREVGNKRVPGIGHSSPTLCTPVGRRGTPASVARSGPKGRNPSTIPRMATHRSRLQLDF